MTELSKENEKPDWLSELQQKSWEPEILLSGIVLYGMFQAPGLLDRFYHFAKENFYGNSGDLETLIALVKIAFYWLIFGLITHLISRGIWVGMVGLSFTFPSGIKKEKLPLSGLFNKKLDKIPTIEDIIVRLEKVSSALFSISFMLFMMMIGSYLFILITVVIPVLATVSILGVQFLISHKIHLQFYVYIFLGIACVGLLDFLTLGYLKRFRWFSKLYYPLSVIIATLTLARFYRPVYYTIISNFNRWKIAGFLTLFVIISFFALSKVDQTGTPGESWTRLELWSDEPGQSAYSGYYDDQNDDFHSTQAHIQSDIISENTIRLFVVLKVGMQDSIKKHCHYDSLLTEENKNFKRECLQSFYQIQLDDSLLTNQEWFFQYKQSTDQRGMLTYIDITELPKGTHQLIIKGAYNKRSKDLANIPFYREINPAAMYSSTKKEEPEKEESYLKLKQVLPK